VYECQPEHAEGILEFPAGTAHAIIAKDRDFFASRSAINERAAQAAQANSTA
jgi:hypothetical protein